MNKMKNVISAGEQQDFFGQASRGEHAPLKPLEDPVNPQHQYLADIYQKHKGNFDEHIETSIPNFRTNSYSKMHSILQTYPQNANMLDIASSEGSLGKTITEASQGGIKTTNLDPQENMINAFNTKSQVPGAESVSAAFGASFKDENGKIVPKFAPKHSYDVVHESMAFQFFGPEREEHIAEAKRLLAPDGIFLSEEKVRTDNEAEHEAKKDAWKAQYHTPEALQRKQKQVGFQGEDTGGVGMMDKMVHQDVLEFLLKKHFKYVAQYWSSGNFKGYVASDSKQKIDSFLSNYSNKSHQFETESVPRIVTAKESKWKIAENQDANRMYRQHTDGTPVAETTFESIQNKDTSEPYEDEYIIVNGKKWKKVRRKNNPEPDNYKDPIGGWGFYSKLIERMESQPWVILSVEKAKPIDVNNLAQYPIPRSYKIVDQLVPHFARYGVIPIARKFSDTIKGYPLDKLPEGGTFQPGATKSDEDYSQIYAYDHNIHFYDPETQQIVYGMNYSLNHPNAFEYYSTDEYGNPASDDTDWLEEEYYEHKYPTYVTSIHYNQPGNHEGAQDPRFHDGGRIYLSNLDEKGKPTTVLSDYQETVDNFNQRYPRLSLSVLRWMQQNLPKPIGADIINPKLKEKAQKQDFVTLSKWKISVPPAEKAKEFSEGYEQSKSPLEIHHKYPIRGHKWQLIPENFERLYQHPDWPLKTRYTVNTLTRQDIGDPAGLRPIEHWEYTPMGEHHTPGEKKAGVNSGAIYINPFLSPESANETIWHELQHAYQHQEKLWTPEMKEKYVNPLDFDDSGMTDEEIKAKIEEYHSHPMELDANLFADFMRKYPLIEESEPYYSKLWVPKEHEKDPKPIVDEYYREKGSKRRLRLPSIKSKWIKKSTYLPGYHSVALQEDPETGKYRMYMGAGPQFSHYQSIPANSQLAEYRGIYDPTSGNLIHFTSPTEYQRIFDDPEYREKGWEYLINPEHFDATPEEHEKVWRDAAKEGIHIYETEQQGLNPEFRGVEHFPINSFYLMHRANEDSDKLSLGTTQDENYIPMIDKEKMEENAKRKHHVTFIPSLNNGKLSKWKIAGETRKKRLERASTLPDDTSEIIHTFDDGWTLRLLKTIGDSHREGELMGNCFSGNAYGAGCLAKSILHNYEGKHGNLKKEFGWPYEGNHFPSFDEEVKYWNKQREGDLYVRDNLHIFHDEPLETIGKENRLISLRDPDNLPHVSIDGGAAFGRHNSGVSTQYKKKYFNPLFKKHHENDDFIADIYNIKEVFPFIRQSKWKLAGETKTKLLERASQLPKDNSKIIHQFDNGWTIRELQTVGDHYREGQLMGNCVSNNVADHIDWDYLTNEYDQWLTSEEIEEAENDGTTAEEMLEEIFLTDPSRYEKIIEEYAKDYTSEPASKSVTYHSLRDENNLPHVSFGGGYALGRHNSEIKDEYKKYLDFFPKQSKWIKKEAPARSKAQYRYMQGICNGSIEPPEGMTRAQACEYVEGQSPKDLPEKKSKLDIQQEMEKILIKKGFSEKGAIIMALDYMSKLSYWIDGYHAAVALRDPETEVWHMDVGFNDKLTHGGVTADYINDLGTRAMREAVADKDSRTDYYNYHTARGLYNPTTKDFIHMSHPDFWDETDYNFKSLDQDERDRMEAFWRQLAQQNGVELDSIRVLNNQTGHIEDLSIADFEMPEEVTRAQRMYERNRPLTPWERERGGYDTKTGHVKNAHWIQGFQAAIINQKGELEVAPPDKEILDEEGNVIDVDDTPWYATHWDIGGYPQYRGLYNHDTGELIHMSSPEEHESLSHLREYLESKNDAINPLEHETIWREAAKKSNVPVNDFKLLYEKEEDEYGDEAPYKRWSEPMNQKEDFNLVDPEDFMPKASKWKKKGHWLEDYYAAVITPEGEMKVAKDWNYFHGNLLPDASTLARRGFHRGLYNKETGQLLHMTTPEEWKKLENSWGSYEEEDPDVRWPLGFEWIRDPKDFISPYKTEKEWLNAAENSQIPVSEVKFFSGEPEVNPFVGFDVNKFNTHSPQEIAAKYGKWKTSKKDAWEAVLDGELGHDIITTGTWEEVKKQTIKWLKQLKNGYINKKNPHDNKKIDPEAKEQDGHALEDLKLYEEKKRWSFHFDHGKHPYDLIIQPVGYKESKWKVANKSKDSDFYAIVNVRNPITGEWIAKTDDGSANGEGGWDEEGKKYEHYQLMNQVLDENPDLKKVHNELEGHEGIFGNSYLGHTMRGIYYPATGKIEHLTHPDWNNFADTGWHYDIRQNAEPILNDWKEGTKRGGIFASALNTFGSNLIPFNKISKWKKRSHWVDGFHAAGITPEGEMLVGPKWTTYHGELSPESGKEAFGWFNSETNWRGLYNPETNEVLHMSTPEEYGRFGYTETAANVDDFKNPHDFYRDAWQNAANKSGYPIESIHLFSDPEGKANPALPNDKEDFSLTRIGAWKIADKKKKKIHPKFQTSLKDHQKSVRKYGPLKTHKVRNFKKKSVLNEQQAKELFEYEPYMYHDVAAARGKADIRDQIETVRSIMNNGILPKEETGVSEYDDWLTSRPHHVYIGRRGFYQRTMPPAIRINMSKIDPSTLKPDEDIYHAFGFSDKHKDEIDMHELKSAPFEEEHRNNPDYTLGKWMDDNAHLDTPKNVLASYGLNNSLAVLGGVPADALEINPEWIEQIKERHGIDITKML